MMARYPVVIVALCACASASPPVTYYDMSTLELSPVRYSAEGPVVRVDRFSAAPGFASDEIVMRSTDFHVESYVYHRWRASSADLVTELMADALAGAGSFCRVDVDELAYDADVVVTGRILRLEGVRKLGGTIARASIAITARIPGTGGMVLSRRFVHEAPVTEHSVEALVRAFREGLLAIAGEVVPRLERVSSADRSCGRKEPASAAR